MAARIECTSARAAAASSCVTGSQPPTSFEKIAACSSPDGHQRRFQLLRVAARNGIDEHQRRRIAPSCLNVTAGAIERKSSTAWSGRAQRRMPRQIRERTVEFCAGRRWRCRAPRLPKACSVRMPGKRTGRRWECRNVDATASGGRQRSRRRRRLRRNVKPSVVSLCRTSLAKDWAAVKSLTRKMLTRRG